MAPLDRDGANAKATPPSQCAGGVPSTASENGPHRLDEAAVLHTAMVHRLRADFMEMPGLCVTLEQAQRLCGMDRATCHQALSALLDLRFLLLRHDGHYARVSDGPERHGHHGRPVYW